MRFTSIVDTATILVVVLSLFQGCSDSLNPENVPTPVYPLVDYSPSWSPDTSRILFYHRGITEIREDGSYLTNPDSTGIWVVDPDGLNKCLILNAYNAIAEWDFDGNWIVYSTNAQIYKAMISGYLVDTTSIKQLTSHDGNFFPSWNPDGQWIAYDSDAGGVFSVWKMRSDGTQKQNIKEYGREPQWFPDGESILYIKYLGQGVSEIFSMNSDGSNEKQISHLGGYIAVPKYSRDGAMIVFVSGEYIWTMNSNGEEVSQVVKAGVYPAWSPEGNRIVFVRFDRKNHNNNGTLWIVNIDGTELQQITYGPIVTK